MYRNIFILLILLLNPLVSANVEAESNIVGFPSRMDYIVGEIEDIGLDQIVIFDERDKLPKVFYYFSGNAALFKKGDRVRVYFLGRTVESIKKMTPVEYIKGQQNIGFIYKAE